MKRLLLMLFMFTGSFSKAQNIVPNPSFEQLDSICPISYFIQYSYLWESANAGTPDVFDTCLGIPQNSAGYQFANTGKGMAGIALTGPNVYREYLEIKLDSALKDAHTYCVEYWISMADYGTVATHPPQIYFSDTPIIDPGTTVLNFVPQFEDTTVFITDTANWIMVSGQFTSYCNCQYMLIGNFHNDANTDTIQMWYPYNSAYYYIDDVSIEECIPAGVKELQGAEISVYPNPARGMVSVDGLSSKVSYLSVYNSVGQVMLREDVVGKKSSVDINGLTPGLYYLKVEGEKQRYVQKLLIE